PPPTLSLQELGNQSAQNWELLGLLRSVSASLTAVPHVNMGPRAGVEILDADQCQQLPTAVNHVEIPDLTSLDPAYFPNQFTFSAWIQVSNAEPALQSLDESLNVIFPLLAFVDTETGSEFSVHIDCRLQSVIVKSTSQKRKKKQEVSFLIPTLDAT